MKRRYFTVWAAALLLLTACAASPAVIQESQTVAETSSRKPEQAAESSGFESTAETTEQPSDAKLPESEFVFGTVAEKAKLLPYDEFAQERLMFSALDVDYAAGNVLRSGFVFGAPEQMERCKELFAEAAHTGSEAEAEDCLQTAALLDDFAAQYSSEDYMYLVFCGQNAYDKSKYRSYLGTDIAFDGEHIELVPRYEITDEEQALHEQVPAVEPPQYLWVAAVPRTFLSAE